MIAQRTIDRVERMPALPSPYACLASLCDMI